MMDLTPRVIETYDDERYDRDARIVRRVTVVTFRVGELGPFREEFGPGELTESALKERIQRRVDALRPFAG